MGLEEHEILGSLVDEMDSEESQEDFNYELLKIHDSQEFLNQLKRRMSRYMISFYLGRDLEEIMPTLWKKMLNELIRVYSLNALKVYLSPGMEPIDFNEQIRKLMIFIKYSVINLAIDGKISYFMNVEEFKNLLKGQSNIPTFMTYFLDYSDIESLNRFIKKVVDESKEEYEEDIGID